MSDLLTRRAATISSCERYRYRLTRYWGPGPFLPFVMLNPSTADADLDDPTIRRCMGFARREGLGGIVVGNLFAWRDVSPTRLATALQPVGDDNDGALLDIGFDAACQAVPVVCAWGGHDAAEIRGAQVAKMLHATGARMVCLGQTAKGHPRHPLYVRGNQPLVPFA